MMIRSDAQSMAQKIWILTGLVLALLWGSFSPAVKAQGSPQPNAPLPSGPDATGGAAINGCIPIDGTTFELSGSEAFLVRKGSASVALVRTSQFLPAGLTSLRFHSGELCVRGAKSQFVVNEVTYFVSNIVPIAGENNTRIARVNESGTAATVTAR